MCICFEALKDFGIMRVYIRLMLSWIAPSFDLIIRLTLYHLLLDHAMTLCISLTLLNIMLPWVAFPFDLTMRSTTYHFLLDHAMTSRHLLNSSNIMKLSF